MNKPLRVIGRDLDPSAAGSVLRSRFHEIEVLRSVAVGTTRDADVEEVRVEDVADADLVELALDDGSSLVTSAGRLRELTRDGVRLRGEDPDLVTGWLPLATEERGLGALALKVLRVFRPKAAATIAGLATRKAVAAIEGELGAAPGLYRLDERGELSGPVEAEIGDDPPSLVFIHGTASSTSGSFRGVFEGTADWRTFRSRYGDRIYALEHRTLSESPVANALALVRKIRSRARLHLVTHSRGGLVGELLCRGGFAQRDLRAFLARPDRPADELDALVDLGKELGARDIRIERFVRVACPAAGTVLASDRLDFYLSLLLNALTLATPDGADVLVESLSAVLIEVARRRADPAELPGLEAQRPGSPLIHFLNGAGAPAVDHDLSVIEGDVSAGTLRATLRAIAAYAFFQQKNDLVVDTRSMRRGLPRRGPAYVSYHEGPEVTHFSYFKNVESRRRILAALSREKREDTPRGFDKLGAETGESGARSPAADPAADRQGNGLVLFLPDYLGSSLADSAGRIWPDAARLAAGALYDLDLARNRTPVVDTISRGSLRTLQDRLLAERLDLHAIPYDWRAGIEAGVAALEIHMQGTQPARRIVAVAGHGLGALSLLALSAKGGEAWRSFRESGGVAVLLAPPLEGCEYVLRLALGKGRLFRMLDMLDGSGTAADVAKLFLSWPGTVDLLPDRALAAEWWRRLGGDAPAATALEQARARRDQLRSSLDDPSVHLVLGGAESTAVIDLDADDELRGLTRADGDGWMIDPRDAVSRKRPCYVSSAHEALPWNADAVGVAVDLIRARPPSAGSTRPPDRGALRTDDEPSRFPTQEELEDTILRGGEPSVAGDFAPLTIQVAHGSLDRLEHPILVGHYRGDGIIGAEAILDACLDGALRRRLAAGEYPGPAGTHLHVAAPEHVPRGALIVGLGDIGELTAAALTQGVKRVVIQYALADLERPGREDGVLTVASLLVGTRGGLQLSVRQSIVAITNGVLEANRVLGTRFERSDSALPASVRRPHVATLCFVELWEDIAIRAGHVVRDLARDTNLDLRAGETITTETQLKQLEGRRGPSRDSGEWSWWRRLIISAERGGTVTAGPADTKAPVSGLRFTILTERARADDERSFTAGQIVEDLLARSPRREGERAPLSIAHTLYEVLLPDSVKAALYDGAELVLVVDNDTACYPWELMAKRRGDATEPLIERVALIRQFRAPAAIGPTPATEARALVVGHPAGVSPPLEGAALESVEVARLLTSKGYEVVESTEENADVIVEKLFLQHYRILHIAAHGNYDAANPAHSGVVLGPPQNGQPRVLSADWFARLPALPELVFLNCCHLGQMDKVPDAPARLAASVSAKLIGMGVRCVVAAGWAVNDRAARRFASCFYTKLLEGFTFGESVLAARREVFRTAPLGTTWGAYQCYGDPLYRLPGGKQPHAEAWTFVSQREALTALEDVNAAASRVGSDIGERNRLRERLTAIETALDPHWSDSGALWYARATAWDALDDPFKTLDHLGRALAAADAKPPIRALEDFANRLARFADVLVDAKDVGRAREVMAAASWAGQVDPQEDRRSLATRALEVALHRIAELIDLSPTAERFGLRGSAYKSLAMIQTEPGRRPKHLRLAAEAYARGIEHEKERSGRVPLYPGIPAVQVHWALGTGRNRKELRYWLEECRRTARDEASRDGRTFWNQVSQIDADLLDYLLTAKVDPARQEALVDAYADCLARYGRESERDSTLRSIRFLEQLAEESAKPSLHKFSSFLQTLSRTLGAAPSQER